MCDQKQANKNVFMIDLFGISFQLEFDWLEFSTCVKFSYADTHANIYYILYSSRIPISQTARAYATQRSSDVTNASALSTNDNKL